MVPRINKPGILRTLYDALDVAYHLDIAQRVFDLRLPVPEPARDPPQIAAQPVAPELAAPKPAAPKPAAPKPAAPKPAAAKPAVQTAARTPSGAYVVQVAALKVRDGARSAWARLQRAHPGLLGDKQLTVKKVDLGARGIFYRVRAGFFADRAGASALCRALKARQQDCLVAKR